MDELTLDYFKKWEGAEFSVRGEDDAQAQLRLDEAEATPEHYSHDRFGKPITEGFSLIFSGPADCSLAQGTYTFTHPKAGEFSLFMTPVVSMDPDRRHFQIIFSRLLKRPALD